MAKKSSKASSPSWRTLMRRAKDEEKAGKPKVAATLRAQASQARKGTRKTSKPRSDVVKKAWETRRANQYAASVNAEIAAVQNVDYGKTRMAADRAYHALTVGAESPGHGEIVGGAEHQFAEEIAKLARKKGGKDAIQNLVTNRIALARAEGQSIAERGRSEMSQRQHEATCDRVVCGALATWEMAMSVNGGLPSTCVVSGYTVARIMDVLNRHGYTGNGRSNKAIGS